MRDKYAQEFRYSILKVEDYFSLLAVFILGYFYFKSPNLYLLGFGALGVLRLLYLIIRRWNNREVFVRINQKGIEFCKKNKFYPWDEITHTYIDTITKKYGNKSEIEAYLYVHTTGKRKKINIDSYNYSYDKFNSAVKYYGGKEMGINPTAEKPTLKGLMTEIKEWLSNSNNLWKAFYALAFISGIFAMIGVIKLYRKTMIDVWLILAFGFTVAWVGMQIWKKHFDRINGPTANWLIYIYAIGAWGGWLSLGVLWINFQFAAPEISQESFEIISKTYNIGKHNNCSVFINYDESKKELMFNSDEVNLVKKSSRVEVQIRKGALGFDVLDDYQLMQ